MSLNLANSQISEIINSIVPGAKFHWAGNNLIWEDTDKVQPTLAEIEAKYLELESLKPVLAFKGLIKRLLADSDYLVLPDRAKNPGAIEYRAILRGLLDETDITGVQVPPEPPKLKDIPEDCIAEYEASTNSWKILNDFATAEDFFIYTKKQIALNNASKSLTERARYSNRIMQSLTNWSLDADKTEHADWVTILSNKEDLTQADWNDFKTTIQNTKGFNGNDNERIATDLVGIINSYETKRRFK